jgi:hypothetical protein
MRTFALCVILLSSVLYVSAQTTNSLEKRVALTETAVALDATGGSALEATLNTTALGGTADTPVTNIRMVVKNSSPGSYAFVSGLVTFYDAAGVRCAEGLFKADALANGESFETDAPGIRIRCAPATWRIVAINLLPRVVPGATPTPSPASGSANLIISVDGEQHPIQLDKPMVVSMGDKQRTIVVRAAP